MIDEKAIPLEAITAAEVELARVLKGFDYCMPADGMQRVLTAALSALRPGSTGETDGWVLVPKDALRWLNGEHEDGFERPADARGNFWWRTEFKRRAMLAAAGGTE